MEFIVVLRRNPEGQASAFYDSARAETLGGPWTGMRKYASRMTEEAALRLIGDLGDYCASKGFDDMFFAAEEAEG